MSNLNKSIKKPDSRKRAGISILSALPLGVLAGAALIVVVGILAYLPCISGGFVLDDNALLTDSGLISASSGLYLFWCTNEPIDYWPVTNTTFWFEWRLWGMHPTGYHFTNLILHVVESLLIWLILRKLFIPGAFLAAMIFAVHPVNVEAVAWIAQRKDVTAMLFFLLSILCYLKHLCSRHTPCAGPALGVCGLHSGSWYWLSLAAFVLAMLSKGSAVVLPALLLVIVWWLRTMGTVPIFVSTKTGLSPSISRRDLVQLVPFFIVAAVLAGVNVWFQTHGTETVIRTAGIAERLLGAGCVAWFYLYKALLPVDLIFVYPHWQIEADNPLWWLPLLAVLAVTVVLWWYRTGWSRPFLFAWGYFCVALAPVMGFTDVGFMRFSLVADRYQHIAVIGVITLTAAGWSIWHHRDRKAAHGSAVMVAIVSVGVLIFLTCRQSWLFRDANTLYRVTLEKNPGSWLVHNNLGSILFDTGRQQEAMDHYRRALALKPDYAEAYYNLGVALMQTGHPEEAIEHYKKALRFKPNDPEVHYNLGYALAQTGRFKEAIEHSEQALRLHADYAEAHNNLGVILTHIGRPEEAIEHCETALRLKPSYPEAHYNLGLALAKTGRTEEAVDHYRQALALKSDYPEAHVNLGNILLQTARPAEAIEHYRQAIRLRPDFTRAYSNLALAYAGAHQSSQAMAAMQEALELARSQGQADQAGQIEKWLNSYRAGLSDVPSAPPGSQSVFPTPSE
jgi:Flp pilus assembly protein TadD